MRRLSLLAVLCFPVAIAGASFAQEAAATAQEEVDSSSEVSAPDQPEEAEAATDAEPDSAASDAESDPAESADEQEVSVEEEPVEPTAEPEANQKSDGPAEAEDAEEVEEGADDEGLAEEVGNDDTDWAGILERFPAFFALTHHAAVHLPIALWLLGALFVVIGLFAPSWRNQIPLACLIGGALSSVAAAASGWWYAHYEYGEEWAWADGLGDFDTKIVQHRWTGVTLVVASLVLSVIALVSQKKQSKGLGFIWRVGLLVLAAAVGWEGHIGGELVMGEGFLEEAIEAWLTGE